MDPLQSLPSKDNTEPGNPLIVTNENGDVCIQLEGSHTTATETEGASFKEQKNVKFEDDKDTTQQNWREGENSKIDERKCKIAENVDTEDELTEVWEIKEKIPTNKAEKEEPVNESTNLKVELKFCAEKVPEERSPSETESDESQTLHFNKNLENLMDISINLNKIPLEHHDTQEIADENMEISVRFKQIMAMFDSFTKNLETLDLTAETPKRRRSKSLLTETEQNLKEPQKHKSRYEEYYKQQHKKTDCQDTQPAEEPRSACTSASSNELLARNRFEEYLKQQEMELIEMENYNKQEIELNEKENYHNKESLETRQEQQQARSIATGTSICELKTLACQTLPTDHISLNDLSLMEVSSLTSKSEQPNSLNNYAQPENACLAAYNLQHNNDQQPLIECKKQQTPLPAAVVTQEPLTAPDFNIISIEANPIPSATELRRAPLCHRLWSALGDFCAATILCLQVNRDCIFCLGFFAAFVVSASFLTAFFYHTLSVSPSLW